MRRGLLLLAFLAAPGLAAEVAGVKVDERVELGPGELVLNGAGLRTRVFFKIYVAGLYLAEKRTHAEEVLA
ncbi:MAG TPA: chalcone isomerase family protein, partial [Burkholderiales bacterium]|nr:chalcone isomerase family protein [Burkholderiales bacterium]